MKYKTVISLFVIVAATSSLAMGQTQIDAAKTPVSGKVIDNKQAPVSFSTVIFVAKSDSTKLYTVVTDEFGTYSITVPFNSYTVEARCIGYFPSQIQECTAANTQSVKLPDIVMEESVTNLRAAIVQANTIERRADRFIVNLSANPIAAGRTLYESLSYLPGVTTRNGISINGKSGTKVMVNNRMLNLNSDQIEQYLNNLRAEDIQKVEVIPEAGSEYDADATGGILKITLKQQTVTGYFGTLSANIARAVDYTQSSRPSFNLSFRKDKWSVISNTYYSFFSNPDKFEEKTQFFSTQMDVHNTNTTLAKSNAAGGEISAVYEFNAKQSLGMVANYGYSKNDISTDGTSNTVTPTYLGRYTNDNNQYNNFNRLGLSTNYVHRLDSAGSTYTAMVDWLYNKSKNGGDYNTFFALLPPASSSTSFYPVDTISYRNNIDSDNNIINANLDFDIKLGGRNNLKAGGKFFRSQLDNDILYENFFNRQWIVNDPQSDQFTYTENVGALYGTFSSSLGKKWLYTVGLRAEYTAINLHSYKHHEEVSQDYLNLFPSVNLSFQQNPMRGHNITLTANRKIRRPNFSLLRPYTVPLNDFSFVQGNPKLKPAKSINLSLTQTIAHKYTLTAGVTWEQDYFTQVVTEREDQPDILYYQFINLNNHTQWMAAFYAQINLYKWWTLTPGIVGLYIKDTYDVGGGVKSSQKPTVMGVLSSNFILPNGWKPEFNAMYVTGIVQGNLTTGDIYSLNLGCSKSFLSDKLTATLRINNLVHQKLTITTQGDTYHKVLTNGVDLRTLSFSLRYSFNSNQRVNVKKAATGTEEEKARLQ